MTSLKLEAVQLVEQMPEEQVPYIIQYLQKLRDRNMSAEQFSDAKPELTSKMKAFVELERMIMPVSQELDYDKELAEANLEMHRYMECAEMRR